MKTSYQGRAFIAREEGCILSAYKDSVGVLTIGIGHTTAAGPPAVTPDLALTLAQCFDLFAKDIAKYEARVNKALTVPVAQHVFDACVSFDYNTGAIDRASFVRDINSGKMADAAVSISSWNKPPEIVGRRTRERELLMSGIYGDTTTIPVWQRQGGKVTSMPLPNDTAPPVITTAVPQPSPVTAPKPTVAPPPPVITKQQAAAGGIGIALLAAIATQVHGFWAWLSHLFGN